MSDLLSTVYRCDMCGDRHEQRDFVVVANDDELFSICKFCESFLALTEFEYETEIKHKEVKKMSIDCECVVGDATRRAFYFVGKSCGLCGKDMGAFPTIVCLCGSTRFVEIFNEWRKRLTEEGKIVLSIEIVTTQSKTNDPQHTNPELKQKLDELHKRKIDLADEVMVLNYGGYIGESTRSEIEYAEKHSKKIIYLENSDGRH
jgi:hypothetical protein